MREYEEMSKSELVNIIESRDDEMEDLWVVIRNQEVIISDLAYDKEELEVELREALRKWNWILLAVSIPY